MIMPVGRRSVLFGVHQFLWHPITVLLAWLRLYGRPTWKELVCIIVHDWGYWFCPNIDGEEGERHPELGAKLAGRWFGPEYQLLCICHSRHYAYLLGCEPSKLCWADKLSILYEPWWFYLFRAWLSGELKEFRQEAAKAGFVPLGVSHRQWFRWLRQKFIAAGYEKRAEVTITGIQNVAVTSSPQ